MLSVTLISASLAIAYAQYNEETKADVNEVQVEAKNLAEAYIAGKNKNGEDAAIYYSTAPKGSAAWAEPAVLYNQNLIDPRGVALCGPKNEAGQSNWLYVADAGNAEVGGYVYRYQLARDDANPGKLDVQAAEIVYGEGNGDQRPTDVACDEAGNVWWNDEVQDEIRWAKADVLNNAACNHNACYGAKFVGNECENAVANLQGLEVIGNWVYWSNNNDQIDQWALEEEAEAEAEAEVEAAAEAEEIAEANNGLWRVAVNNNLNNAQCDKCVGAQELGQYPAECGVGKEIEFFSQNEEGYVAVAGRNDNVYAVSNGKEVLSLGKNLAGAAKVKADVFANEQLGHASYIANAGERGLLVVDEIKGAAYVVDDNKKVNKAFELPEDVYAYGAAYGEAADFQVDSAAGLAVSALAGVLAIAALF